jgi:general secretion pathway protein G
MRSLRNRRPKTSSRREGFTLMEVLLVLAILGVIIGLVLPNLLGQQKSAMLKAARVQVHSVEEALGFYANDHVGEFPPSLETLLANPGSDPNWKGPYLKKSQTLPVDPWGSPIQYTNPGQHQADQPDVWSMGPDRTSGTADDIGNWSTT